MNIFINPDEDRFRAGWRIAGQIFLMVLVAIALAPLLDPVIPRGYPIGPFVLAIGAVVSTVLAAKGPDYRPWSTYGFIFDGTTFTNIVLGLGLAGGAISVIFIIEYLFGWLAVTGSGWQWGSMSDVWTLAGYFCFMIIVGFWEELIFRGYLILNAAEGLNLPEIPRKKAVFVAVTITSLFFGVGHVFNPNAGVISTVNIVFAGVMLAIPFIITGRLGWSIGLHIGWNFFQGGIFGFPVSGLAGKVSVIQIRQGGPEWLTGGAFGPEAGLLGLTAMLLIVGILLSYFKKTGQPIAIHPSLGIYQSPSENHPDKQDEHSL